MKISGDDGTEHLFILEFILLDPSLQMQESRSLTDSTTYATFGISISATYPSLDSMLKNVCRVDGPTSSSVDQEKLHRKFENDRVSLQRAFDLYKSLENQKTKEQPHKQIPETLAAAVSSGLSPSIKESVLQSYCFDDLQIIGENYCLENTSLANVLGSNVEADNFRKSNFPSNHEKSSQPDLTLRLRYQSDSPMKKYNPNPPKALEPYRLFPWSVVAYLELKRWSESLSSHCSHALYYCQQTLSCCPDRNYFITALYNFRSVIFCMAVYINGEMKCYTTGEITGEPASRELAKFLTFNLQTMGFRGEFPLTQCTPIRHLGRGSTSVVLEVQYENERYVAKISRNRSPLKVERMLLKYLKRQKSDLAVPTAVDETDNSGLYAAFRTSNPTILIRPELTSLPQVESSSNQLPYVSFFEEVYGHRFPSQSALKHFKQLWYILKEAHKCGISHRDVRLPNLGFKKLDNSQYDVYLLDWSSSKPFVSIPELRDIPDDYYLQGCTSTASINVLKQMIRNRNNYLCFPSDEAISVIYLAYQLKSTNSNLGMPKQPESAIDTWFIAKQLMPPQVLGAINALEQLDTDEVSGFYGTEDNSTLDQYLNQIEGHVLAALADLF